MSDEEAVLVSSLKFQDYTSAQLIELAVGFIQSSYVRAAAEASQLSIKAAGTNAEFLKAAYLRATCLHQLGDYRAVVDLAFEALTKAEVQDDILSFLYLQAEAWDRLGKKSEARRALKKILAIDAKYRLTRERLERLNEI
jgi:tetratricopeptide (TPR) repeat protein